MSDLDLGSNYLAADDAVKAIDHLMQVLAITGEASG